MVRVNVDLTGCSFVKEGKLDERGGNLWGFVLASRWFITSMITWPLTLYTQTNHCFAKDAPDEAICVYRFKQGKTAVW